MNQEQSIQDQFSDRLMPVSQVFQEDVDEDVSVRAQELMVKAGLGEEAIALAVDAARPFIKPITSEEDLTALQKGALTPLVHLRVRIEKLCKRGRERANMERAAWIKMEKYAIGQFSDVEDRLAELKQEWKEREAKAKEEEEREAERQCQYRYGRLEAAGATRRSATDTEPERFVIGDAAYPVADIDSMDEADLSKLEASASALREEAERVAQEKERELREAKEAAQRVAEREAALTAKMIAVRRAELKNVGAEPQDVPQNIEQISDEDWEEVVKAIALATAARKKAKEDAATVQARCGLLIAAGFRSVGDTLIGEAEGSNMEIPVSSLLEMTDERINTLCASATVIAAKRRAEKEEQLRVEGEERERQRAEAERIRKEQERQEKEAQMGDVERWDEWTTTIYAAQPVMNSAIGKHAVKTLVDHIAQLSTGVRKDLQ